MTTLAESPSTPAARPVAPPQYSHRQILVIMSGLMLGMLLAALDQTIVSTALTRISLDFHRTDLYSWVVTAYLLTSTASTPLYGKISDLFGRKTVFQVAIVIFLIGSALCGLSQNMYQLILFRGVQGLGAGGLLSLALAIVGDVIPPRQRGRYQGYFGAVFAMSSVLGPLVGGLLVDNASWRWVFYVNIPIGIVALVVINRVLRISYERVHARIDWAGALLMVGGVSLVLVAVQDVGQQGRVSPLSLLMGIIGIGLFLAFLAWETRASEPLLPLRLFRNPIFRISSALCFISGIVIFGGVIFLPQYMQTVRGVDPTMSGLRLTPMLGGVLIASITTGRLVSRYGRYRGFVISGTFVLALGVLALTTLKVDTGWWVLSGTIFVLGAGLGLFMQTTVLATQNSVDPRDMGTATSAVTFFRTLGGAIGASVLGAILISYERGHTAGSVARYGPALGAKEAFTHGITQAYLWLIPVAVIGFVVSFRLREMKLRGDDAVVTSGTGGPGADKVVADAVPTVGEPYPLGDGEAGDRRLVIGSRRR